MQVMLKPFQTEAMLFDGSLHSVEEVSKWANDYIRSHPKPNGPPLTFITHDGDGRRAHDYMLYNLYLNTSARPGDWVMRTPEGDFIAVKPGTFKRNYTPGDGLMDWSTALLFVKSGMRAARAGWNGEDMFIALVPQSIFEVNRPPWSEIYPEGTELSYHAHIDMRTAQGDIVPWLASQTDQLAEDWVLVP